VRPASGPPDPAPPAPLWLITGGAGFIGSSIAVELVGRGQRVRILDNLSTGKLDNLAGVREEVEFVPGDVRDLGDCHQAVAGATYVLHQAAIRSVKASVDHPTESHESNATGTLNMLVAAREANVKRFVYASSSAVYGECPRSPQKETFRAEPVSPYGCQKLAGEQYAIAFTKLYGLETVSLRYFNVFGPRQDPEGSGYSAVIPRFMEQAYRGEPLEVHGDGTQQRDFTHVANVVSANLLAATTTRGVGQTFNIGDGRAHSLNQLIRAIERIVRRKLDRASGPRRPGDVRKSLADITRARSVLGYEPVVRFEDGLRDTWRYFLNSYFRSAA
jgi:nucleoside-diphosphate-sugar epimerase